jgi:hypothetical protein
MSEIKRRVAKLEGDRPQEPGDRELADFTKFWEIEIEWTALHLIRGIEPRHTVDEAGAFWSLDGRLACSRTHMDLQALMGHRTEELEEAIPPERWGRFLAHDGEAKDLLARLLELAQAANIPEDFKQPFKGERTQEQTDATFGENPHKPFALFVDASEKERVRALTWTLIHNSDARAMLAEITKRRDAFVQEPLTYKGD